MHDYLKQCIRSLADFWEQDPRALAFAMNGSGGRGNDDEWSDADVVLIVRDEAYSSVYGEMREHMARICGDIRLWLLEGESDRNVNFAFLFEKDGEQFLMDHALFSESMIAKSSDYEAGVIFFDRSGALTLAGRRFKDRKPPFTLEGLPEIVDTYLIYTYLNGKYYRRKDTAKLIYIQNTLMNLHMRLMRALYPDLAFSGWWCGDIHLLPKADQDVILLYAAPPDVCQIGRLVSEELAHFGRGARRAFALAGIAYPDEREQYVKRQLKDAGLPVEEGYSQGE